MRFYYGSSPTTWQYKDLRKKVDVLACRIGTVVMMHMSVISTSQRELTQPRSFAFAQTTPQTRTHTACPRLLDDTFAYLPCLCDVGFCLLQPIDTISFCVDGIACMHLSGGLETVSCVATVALKPLSPRNAHIPCHACTHIAQTAGCNSLYQICNARYFRCITVPA